MFEELQAEFGRMVRVGREESGLTQELTAELLEISPSKLRRIEQGKGGANWGDWAKLSELFSIDLSSLQRKHLSSIIPYVGTDLVRESIC